MRSSRALLALLLGVALGCPSSADAAGPPQIPASWVADVTSTSAVLRAEINPNGLATSYRFEYLTEAAYLAGGESFAGAASTRSAGAGSGTAPLTVFASLANLAPTTAYRYRPVATNSAATTIGPEHVLTTEEATNVHPPIDGRGFELVSPVDKDGGAIAAPESLFGGGAFQAAAAGSVITYSSASSFAGGAGAPGATQYLSARGAGGWSTENITTPALSGSYGDHPDGVPYRLFSADLSRALLNDGVRCRDLGTACPVANPPLPGSGAPAGYRDYYLRSSGGFQALLRAADPAFTSLGPEELELALAGATPDLAHVVLSSCARLSADATEVPAAEGCDEGEQNLYEWSGGGLSLVNLLPGQSNGTSGAVLAAPAGAISSDGGNVYFTALEDGALYLREVGKGTKLVPETVGGGASFQVASGDGLIAYFLEGGGLYRYDAGTEASTAIASGVSGVLGASADGSVLYYQDASGLERWRGGVTTQVAPGADVAAASDYLPATGTSRISADGLHLAFLSAAEIPPFDNTDAGSRDPDTELYLYGPPPGGGPAQLNCASCNPSGERPRGSASIPGAVANGSLRIYKSRVLASDGDRVFFDTADRLVTADTDSRPDVYEWEARGAGDCAHSPGCLGLISGGRGEGGAFLDASADGADAFFLSGDSLVGADPGSIDVYDARVGGGLPEAEKPIACIGDACQALPSPPDDPTPGTLVPNAGNGPVRIVKPKKHRHHKKRHRHRHRKHHHRGHR
ncbi:MAG TPA: hypothetical protein VH275_05285 [Solirubrobacterales bacterium]|jgi:hypothetical protein|nr:hypothetical protein [Solirubrobacterales bacterium]